VRFSNGTFGPVAQTPVRPDIAAQRATRRKATYTTLPNDGDRIEVLVGIQRRQRISVDQMRAVLEEAGRISMTSSYVAYRRNIFPNPMLS